MRVAQAVKCAAVLESMLPRESNFIAFDVRLFFYGLLKGTAANLRAAQAVKCAAVLESMLPRESDFIAFDEWLFLYVLPLSEVQQLVCALHRP
jgi:hypothetical protein